MTGTSFTFLVCVLFNEVWWLSGAICAIFQIGSTLLITQKLDKPKPFEGFVELLVKAGFSVVCYLVVAYNVENLRKESYFGREAQDKSFKRWLKVFDGFAHGVALVKKPDVKNDLSLNHPQEILYANKNLYRLLELDENSPSHTHDEEAEPL